MDGYLVHILDVYESEFSLMHRFILETKNSLYIQEPFLFLLLYYDKLIIAFMLLDLGYTGLHVFT